MTQLPIRALSEQMATATPSPSAVPFSNGAADAALAPHPAPAQPASGSPAASGGAEARAPGAAHADSLQAVAKQIESYLQSTGRMLEFRVDEDTGRTIITVRDSQTGETVRQIPGDEALRLARSLGNQTNALIDLHV